MSRSTSSSSSSSDAFDELAALFMTPADVDAHHNDRDIDEKRDADHGSSPWRIQNDPASVNNTPFLELLLVGHLPVRGNLWLTPYADAVARELGPVAMIRLDGDHPTLEIMRGPERWRQEIAGQSLRAAIDFVAGDIQAWIIRPGAGDDAISPHTVASADRLMLLSSADQAASVAAYQTFKRLKHTADHAEVGLPEIALTVVGSQPESATWMVRRLQATATTQLGLSVFLERVLPRIDNEAGQSMYVSFTDESVSTVDEVVLMIRDAMPAMRERRGRSDEAPVRPEHATSPLTPGAPNGRHRDAYGVDSPRAHAASVSKQAPTAWDPIVRSDDPSRESAPKSDGSAVRPASPRIKLAPKPAQRARHDETRADDSAACEAGVQGRLSEHVSGLTHLDIRSPKCATVEFAVDEAGRLHLLADEADLRNLRIVESWAKSHRELLTLALADHGVDPASEITCHLFTSEPSTVADLHGTEIRLHVLAPVEVEGRQGWYAAALNQ